MNPTTATRVPSPDVAVERQPQLPAVAEPQKTDGAAAERGGAGYQPQPTQTPVIPQTSIAHIASSISAVMTEIGVVLKDGYNKFHQYNYAKMEDILQRLTPLMAKHGLVVVQTEIDRSMFDNDAAVAVRYAFTICHSSGEVWPERLIQTGLSRCRDSKGGFDDKSFNKAHTAARKYFLLALFQIPTDDDADAGANDGPQKPKAARVPAAPPTDAGGLVKPHAFTAPSAEAWAIKFLAFLGTVTTAQDLFAWTDLNANNLDMLEKKNASEHKRVMAAIKARRETIGETVTKDGEIVPNKASDGVPNAAADPEGFLKWADRCLAAVTDAEKLEPVYLTQIAPRSGDLFPPDKEELQGLLRRHEKRLAP